ncbi:MAG: transposase family protein [Rhodobacteraceae bacterium]|nr:transposase family protein [Paracoccaceae bacterium]
MPRTVATNHPPHFLGNFSRIDGPRQAAKVLFPLEEIFFLVLCAVISGAGGWSSIALYGRKKSTFCAVFCPLPMERPAMTSSASCSQGSIWSNSSAVL